MPAQNLVRIYDPEVGEKQLNVGLQLTSGVAGGSLGAVSVAGVAALASAGINPAASAADNVLAAITIPAGAFAAQPNGIEITAYGSFANNANAKRVRVYFNPSTANVGSTVGTGGTVIIDSGAWATAGAGIAWCIAGCVFKYGAAGSNTQVALHQQAQIAASISALVGPALTTAPESGTILIAVTGNAGSALADITFNALTVVPLS
jgi:hypothetical protein